MNVFQRQIDNGNPNPEIGSVISHVSEILYEGKSRSPSLYSVCHFANSVDNTSAYENAKRWALFSCYFNACFDAGNELQNVADAKGCSENNHSVFLRFIGDSKFVNAFSLQNLLPQSNLRSFYRYNGSLTTPGCNEVVVWTVFTQPIYVSETQVRWCQGKLKVIGHKWIFFT